MELTLKDLLREEDCSKQLSIFLEVLLHWLFFSLNNRTPLFCGEEGVVGPKQAGGLRERRLSLCLPPRRHTAGCSLDRGPVELGVQVLCLQGARLADSRTWLLTRTLRVGFRSHGESFHTPFLHHWSNRLRGPKQREGSHFQPPRLCNIKHDPGDDV